MGERETPMPLLPEMSPESWHLAWESVSEYQNIIRHAWQSQTLKDAAAKEPRGQNLQQGVTLAEEVAYFLNCRFSGLNSGRQVFSWPRLRDLIFKLNKISFTIGRPLLEDPELAPALTRYRQAEKFFNYCVARRSELAAVTTLEFRSRVKPESSLVIFADLVEIYEELLRALERAARPPADSAAVNQREEFLDECWQEWQKLKKQALADSDTVGQPNAYLASFASLMEKVRAALAPAGFNSTNYQTVEAELEATLKEFSRQQLREQAKLAGGERPAVEFSYNQEVAERLGLKEIYCAPYAAAAELITNILPASRQRQDFIDINTSAGQEKFCRSWVENNPGLPLPCVPPLELWFKLFPPGGFDVKFYPKKIDPMAGSFTYLRLLANGEITDWPRYGEPVALLSDSWIERNDDDLDQRLLRLEVSGLLKVLGYSPARVINKSMRSIEASLWAGNPARHNPTREQVEILRVLGLPEDQYEIRHIRFDEYARAATSQDWGGRRLFTQFQDTRVSQQKFLVGGNYSYGGAVPNFMIDRATTADGVATRLVVARRRRLSK